MTSRTLSRRSFLALAGAETKGGVEYYLIEQEGSRFTPLETARRSLEIFRKLHGP